MYIYTMYIGKYKSNCAFISLHVYFFFFYMHMCMHTHKYTCQFCSSVSGRSDR